MIPNGVKYPTRAQHGFAAFNASRPAQALPRSSHFFLNQGDRLGVPEILASRVREFVRVLESCICARGTAPPPGLASRGTASPQSLYAVRGEAQLSQRRSSSPVRRAGRHDV
jgi:hypothetical protein